MSVATETITSTGSWTVPSDFLGPDITIEVAGGQGGSPSGDVLVGGGGAIIEGSVPAVAGDVFEVTIGDAASGATGGTGYHNGGNGTSGAGEGGGGSTSLEKNGLLLVEAAGGGGASVPGTTGNGGPGGYPAGSPGAGAYGGTAGVAGATGANGAAGAVGGGAGAGPGGAVAAAGSITEVATWQNDGATAAMAIDPVNIGDLVYCLWNPPGAPVSILQSGGAYDVETGTAPGSLSGGGVSTWTVIEAVGLATYTIYSFPSEPSYVVTYNFYGIGFGVVSSLGGQLLAASCGSNEGFGTQMLAIEFSTGSGWAWTVDALDGVAVTCSSSGELVIFAFEGFANLSSGGTSGWTYDVPTFGSPFIAAAYKTSASGTVSHPTVNYGAAGSGGSQGATTGFAFLPTVPSSGAGGGACYIDAAIVSGADVAGTNEGNGWVALTYSVADAPLAPTLLSPANSGFADGTDDVIVFEAVYNGQADSGDLSAVALRVKGGSFGSTYNYWTGSGWATTETWIDPTGGLGAASGTPFTLSIPAGELPNGSTYDWNFATEESGFGLQGPFAVTDFALTAEVVPTVALTAPVGAPTTVTPTVSWSDTLGGGDSQTDYEVIYYTEEQVATEGFQPGPSNTTPIYDSGVVASSSTSYNTPSAAGLLDRETYYVFVQVTETGGNVSNWTGTEFTPTLAGPPVPSSITAVPSANATTGNPANLVTVEASLGSFSSITVEIQYSDDEVNWYDTRWGAALTPSGGVCSCLDEEAPFNVPRYYRARSIGVSSGVTVHSNWTSSVFSELTSSNWWVSIPTVTGLINVATLDSEGNLFSADVVSAVKLWRTQPVMATTTATMVSGNLTPSLAVDRPEQQGIFWPLSGKGGRATAIVCRGVMQAEQFAVTIEFWDDDADAEFAIFDAIRSQQVTVLLRSDMDGACYYVALGATRPGVILREGGRMTNPKRQLVQQVTPVGRP